MVSANIHNILVVKLRTLGDILTTFPLLRALKELYPHAGLTMITDEQYRSLIETNPRVNEFWGHPAQTLRARGPGYAFQQQRDTIRSIRKRRFDLFIDLYGSLRTALWGFLGGIPYRLGFALRGRKYFYTQRIHALHRYVVDLNLQFAQTLGWQGKDNSMEFFITPADETAARQFLKQQGWDVKKPYVVVSPGGGWALKQWGAKRFGQVVQALVRQTGCQVIISGSQTEQPLVEECGREVGSKVIPVIGLPLRQLAAVIKGSRLFLGNDSGPKYFAESYKVPTLICYGPTDFLNNNPDTPQNRVVFHAVPCRPCHSETCSQSRRVCLDDLSVQEVVLAAMELWKLGSKKKSRV